MPDVMKTLLLNPPSFENFDGGASSRWPATREIESYWYPVWLAYPAGMLEGSKLLDAPPHHVSADETIEIAKSFDFLVLFTSTVGWSGDHALARAIKIYKRDMDVPRYNVPFLLHPYIALYSTRGCPAQCTFCLWPQTLSGHAWRKRSTDDVAAEMKWAKENFPHVKEFFFDDDTFNIQKARTIELCEKLKPLGITWSCTSRVTTDRDTLKAMKDAGCRLLIVGFESGDQQILKNIKKDATVERAGQFTKDCHKLGLVVHGDFILGLPGETRETINNTINFAKELDVETIQVSVAHAYPGTELYEYATKNGFMVADNKMVDEGGHQLAHIQYPGLPADEILDSVHRFYDEYYFRPKAAFRILRKAVFDGGERKRLYKEAKTFLKVRAMRHKWVKERREKTDAAVTAEPVKV